MPVVSPNERRSAPASSRCPAICATRSGATSPSYGQPNAVDTIASTGTSLGVRELDELARRDERLGDAAAHVLLVVRLARGHHELELVGLRRERELGALRVRHERASSRRRDGGRCAPSPRRSRPSAGSPRPARTTRPRCAGARCRRARRSAAPGRRPAPAPRSAARRAARPLGSRRAPATAWKAIYRAPATRSGAGRGS